MSTSSLPEVWLRGAVEGYAAELQPVVHALMQALEDVEATLAPLAVDEIWATPGGAASIGFHARHLAGSLDRLFTYARGQALSEPQVVYMKAEGDPGDPAADAAELVGLVRRPRTVVGSCLRPTTRGVPSSDTAVLRTWPSAAVMPLRTRPTSSAASAAGSPGSPSAFM